MKTLYLLMSSLLVTLGAMATDVTFKVNMNNVASISPNGVHVAGSFDANGSTGTAWTPDAYTMTDGDGDGIYEVTITLEPGMYEFKFLNDNDWAGEESIPAGAQVGGGNSNRWAVVEGATDEVGPICFGEVVDCGKSAVVVQVNMSTTAVSPNGVSVAGSIQSTQWTPSEGALANPDGSNIYKRIFAVDPGTYQYKYINGDDWAGSNNTIESVPSTCGVDDGNGGFNREIIVTGDTIVDPICFSSCDNCATKALTLQVDMTNETVSPAGVHVAGAFQGWDPAATPLTDMGNGIWEVTIDGQPQPWQYKFINGDAWGSDESVPTSCNVGGNREVNLVNDTTVIVCFASCTHPCEAFPASSNVTFQVEIPSSVAVSADPDSGGVWLMGSFTNPAWQSGAIKLTNTTGNIYETTVSISGAPEVQYKYVMSKPNTAGNEEESGDFLTDGCGIDNPVSTPNRIFTRSANDTTMCYVWNTCSDCGTVSVNSLETPTFGVSVYPNPSNGITNIEFDRNGNYELMLMDITGKLMLQTSIRGNRYVLNADNLSKGIYLLRIADEANNIATQKITLY